MDTLGPVSVLDSGRRSRDAIITDRLTRRRSPERPRLKASRSDMDVVYRIPQPYRTSFSARQSVERLNVSDRSRSLSPTSSLRSFQSSRSERVSRVRHARAKSPKRVTYDTRVTVRHSDTDDSMFTELSSRDLESSPSHLIKSDFLPMNTSVQSKDSGLDYSLQLRDLSHQILKMDWSTQDKDRLDASFIGSNQDHSPVTGTSRHGILKESQNSRQNLSEPGSGSSPTHGPLHISLSHQGDKENALSADDHVTMQPQAHVSTVASLRDSQYERSHSYRKAITDHYSSEVKALVDAGVEEKAPPVAGNKENGGLVAQQRCSSVSAVSKVSCTNASNQLTPAKRSVSTSISNFFRRISPRLGRKPAKSATPSGPKSGSSQSLPAASGVSLDQDNTNPVSHNPIPQDSSSSQLSRNRIRKSFLKLIGGQHKEVKSKVESPLSADSPQSTDLSSPDSLMDDQHANQKDSRQGEIKPQGGLPQSSQRLLKSIETTNLGKKDVYREFKDKRLPHSTNTDSELEERYRVIKAQYGGLSRPSDSHEMLESCKSQQHTSAKLQTLVAKTAAREITNDTRPTTDFQENPFREFSDKETVSDEKVDGGARLSKAEPPRSLNVIPPRAVRLLQASTISTISGDESIGECSLDFNLTASEPSLLSGTSQSAGSNLSKKIVLSHSLFSSTDSQVQSDVASTTDSASTPQHHQKDALLLGQELAESCLRYSDKENASPLSPTETAHKPSYLKLSCAVSGYGKYSRYSSYKNIPTRSPFSSTLSLRSDISSPDSSMPSFKSPKEPAQGHLQATFSMAEAHHNGQSCLPLTLNGHTMQDAGHYPTGNPVKDGEYFLSLTAMEEEQLRQQASQAEAMMRSQDLPEEVNGRVRAAIGKSNLLINQKFEQFRELCQQHMHQDPTDRVPLWEDLQGFWDMIKIQVDNVEDMFAEIQHMSENGWKEIPKQPSRRSSASSSPKSGSLSQTSTPSATPGHTPGSKRKGLKPNNKDTPDSSPERTQKARSTAKARDEARKKLLAEKRAAMKQQQQEAGDIEIYVPETK